MGLKEEVMSLVSGNSLRETTDLAEAEELLQSVRDKLVKMSGEMPDGGYTFKSEIIKFDSNGQWSLDKANTLDYSKMKPRRPEARSIDYSKLKDKAREKSWKGSIDRARRAAEAAKTPKLHDQVEKQGAMAPPSTPPAPAPDSFSTGMPPTRVTGTN